MARGRWPAPITRAEGIQLFTLLVILAVGGIVAFSTSSQLITPIPWGWRLAATLPGCVLGVRLGQILTRVNRDYNDVVRNGFGMMLTVFLGGFIFYSLAWTVAERVYFRDGGTPALATYPVARLTQDKHHLDHGVAINPFGLTRAAVVPIATEQYRALVKGCGVPEGDCSGARLCVTLPIERAPGGAVRVMVSESWGTPERRPIAPCT